MNICRKERNSERERERVRCVGIKHQGSLVESVNYPFKSAVKWKKFRDQKSMKGVTTGKGVTHREGCDVQSLAVFNVQHSAIG